MASESWRRIEMFFHAAVELPVAERPAYLATVCGDDVALRAEVEALIRSFEDAGDFIERPVLIDSIPQNEKSNSSEIIGRRVGAYDVLSLIGSGGMGEVYLARDVRLGRKIALKLLPVHFTLRPGFVQRFEREARAASALNHPNILTIYDTGRDNDVHFIATEYVAGRTLRQIIAMERLSASRTVEIGLQIADALAAAHEAGIVHRDIKPENVIVRSDGLVKLLDFGMAKPVQSESVTGSLGIVSDPKILMGTIAYLSPEQARGEKVDHRTDVFSLGVVLYEMTTGTKPFANNPQGATLEALLDPIPVALDGKEIPEALKPVLRRALEKDRHARRLTAADLREDLKRIGEESARREQTRPGRLRSAIVIGAMALVSGIAALVLQSRASAKAAPFLAGPVKRITDQPGWKVFPSISPDGQSVVYASRASGTWDIYIQKIGEPQPRNLTPDGRHVDIAPAFSPDGKQIAFHSSREGGEGVFLMDSDGRNMRRVIAQGHNPAWSPDGRELVVAEDRFFDSDGRSFGQSRLHVVSLQTGARRLISKGDALQPSWSPNGKWVAYWGAHKGGQCDIWIVPAAGGDPAAPPKPTAVTDDRAVDWNPVWSSDGLYLYFLSDRGGSMNLWRAPIDPATGKPSAALQPATLPSVRMQHLSLSADGRTLVYAELSRRDSVWQISFDPETAAVTSGPTQLTTDGKRHSCPQPSPDETSLAYVTTGEAQENLYMLDRRTGQARQLTADASQKRSPRWSPDGKRIAFSSDLSGKNEIWTINRDGGGLRRLTDSPQAEATSPVWSPDGLQLFYQLQGGNAFLLDMKDGAQATPHTLAGNPITDFFPSSWSPDGKYVAGWQFLPDKARGGILIYDFARGHYEQLTESGWNPVWLKDSRRLLVVELGKMFVFDVVTRTKRQIFSLPQGEFRGHAISADNKRLYYSHFSNEADIFTLPLY